MYFSGQGRVYIGGRDVNGNPLNLLWVGNVSALEVSMETKTLEHSESYTGQRLTDLKLETGKTANIKATFEDWDPANLARVLRGTVETGSVVAVVDEDVPTLGTTLTGASALTPARFMTRGKNVSSVSLEDNTGVPIPFVLGTHFRVASAAAGLIEIYALPAGVLVEPLQISYTPGVHKQIGMFTQGATEYYMMFDGLNTAAGNAPVIAEFYKVQFNPASSIPLINAELGTFEVSGSVLIDSARSGDTVTNPLGQFGRITQV